jgi:hypothetical protein
MVVSSSSSTGLSVSATPAISSSVSAWSNLFQAAKRRKLEDDGEPMKNAPDSFTFSTCTAREMWNRWYIGNGLTPEVGPYRLLQNCPKQFRSMMSKAKKVMYCMELALQGCEGGIGEDSTVAKELSYQQDMTSKILRSNALYDLSYKTLLADKGQRQIVGGVPDYNFSYLYGVLERLGWASSNTGSDEGI